MNQTTFYALIFFALMFSACKKKLNAPDVSGVVVDLRFADFNEQLFAINDDPKAFSELLNRYPKVLPFYLDYYLDFFLLDEITHEDRMQFQNMGVDAENFELDTFFYGREDTLVIYFEKLSGLYTQWPAMRELFADVSSVIDREKMEIEFTKAFKYFKHYFPQKELPKNMFPVVAPFRKQHAFRIGDDAGVELDMYLGKDYKYYQGLDDLRDKQYVLWRFDQAFMVRDFMENMLHGIIPPNEEEELYQQMIQEGKFYFALKRLLPGAHDSIIFQYPERQLDWINQNVGEVYAMLWDQDALFKLMTFKTRKYVEDGPFTNTIHPDCPSRVGCFIGYKILEAYQSKTKKDLKTILEETDHRQILDKAGYKPPRN